VAHLIHPTIINYVNAAGRRVKKGTRGAKKVSELAKKWYGVGIPGLPPKKRVPLAADKVAAQRMLDNLVRDAEKGHARLPDQQASRKPLAEHLADFEKDVALGLASAKGKRSKTPDPRQVKLVVQRVRDVLDGCKFKVVGDLNSSATAKLATYLNDRVKLPRSKGGLAVQTAGFLLSAARRFVVWLAKSRVGVAADLFDTVPSFNAANDRVHARRDVPPEELAKVLDTALKSLRTAKGLAGPDRYHLYITAFVTGFRANELAALTPPNFHLAADPPSVSLPGKVAKNRKVTSQVLPAGVAITLRDYLVGKPTDKPLWPGMWHKHAAKMLRVDLEAAGVPYCVEGANGKEYADFHALRHTFCSALSALGAGTKELQTLARHSDPRLTLGIYTHSRSAELVKVIDRLQVPGSAPSSPLAKMSRDELERAVVGLAIILGTVLGSGSLLAPPLAPTAGIPADSGARLDTSGGVVVRRS